MSATRVDPESAEWVQALSGNGPRRDAAVTRLHELLVRIARGEVRRRGPRLQITGPELEDLAYQAAADALLAVTSKLGQFRGESRFTTWACKFVIFEVSAKTGRHFWRNPSVPMDAENWDRLPARFGFDPALEAEWRDLLAALHRAVDEGADPTAACDLRRDRARINVRWTPWSFELGSNRNAVYKMLFDARRKLRAALAANGYLDPEKSRRS